ncbi:MAG: response regulator [Leptolyngbyaceae bacterium]|nr:response regulator [Leptolyngbyaceae bacterium]
MNTDYPRYRILLVDDENNNRMLIIRLLRGLNYDLHDVSNGEEAVKTWQSWKPHLILMDMRMPIMNGYVATREIRKLEQEQQSSHLDSTQSEPSFQTTKILAITANAFEEEEVRIFEAGCDAIIHKPFRVDQLRQTIAQHLESFSLEKN